METILGKSKKKWINPVKHRIKYLKRREQVPALAGKYGIEKKKVDTGVILITVDCLRRDFLSLYGYEKDTTPFLNSIKDKMAVFTDAKAPSSWTWPSIASILCGYYPSKHGAKKYRKIRNLKTGKLPPEIKKEILTIPEIIDYIGGETYFNAGGIPYAELVGSGRFMKIDHGIDEHAARQILRLIEFLKQKREREKPFFAHIHIGDLHEPIFVPPKFINIFGETKYSESIRGWEFQKGKGIGTKEWEEYKNLKINLYRASIRYIDTVLSEFYTYLQKTRFIEKTTVFVTADHGEEFWDHVELEKKYFYDPRGFCGVGHGHNMFREVTDVPLLAFGYGINEGVYEHMVSLTDIYPTVVNILGIKCRPGYLHSRNLLKPGKYPILCEDVTYGYDKRVEWIGKEKFLISEGDRVHWKFDLRNDPEEKKPIFLNS